MQFDLKCGRHQRVAFEQKKIILDIPKEGVVLENGWSIIPLSTTVVSMLAIISLDFDFTSVFVTDLQKSSDPGSCAELCS